MCIIILLYKPKNLTQYLNLFKANDTLTGDTDGFVTVISKREEQPLKINGVVYSIIGLVTISVMFIILYLCTHILESAKCKYDLIFDILT